MAKKEKTSGERGEPYRTVDNLGPHGCGVMPILFLAVIILRVVQ